MVWHMFSGGIVWVLDVLGIHVIHLKIQIRRFPFSNKEND